MTLETFCVSQETVGDYKNRLDKPQLPKIKNNPKALCVVGAAFEESIRWVPGVCAPTNGTPVVLIDNGRSSVQTWGGYPIINDQSKTRFGQKIDAGDEAVISRVALQLKIKKMSFWICFFSMKFQSGNAQFLQSIQIAKI
jgi:hypothetical protein